MKNVLFFLTFLSISGCSISPLYESNQSGESGIEVDVIAEREGQQLRRLLKDEIRDLGITDKNYRLKVTLKTIERSFAETTEKNAQRIEIKRIAHVILKDAQRKIVFEGDFVSASSDNVSSSHGDVIFSLYGRNNRNLLKELSTRIIEGIRVFIKNEK